MWNFKYSFPYFNDKTKLCTERHASGQILDTLRNYCKISIYILAIMTSKVFFFSDTIQLLSCTIWNLKNLTSNFPYNTQKFLLLWLTKILNINWLNFVSQKTIMQDTKAAVAMPQTMTLQNIQQTTRKEWQWLILWILLLIKYVRQQSRYTDCKYMYNIQLNRNTNRNSC